MSYVGIAPDARKTPQPIKAPPTPGIGDGTLKAMVHAREVEYTTEQTDSTHPRVSKTLGPRLGDEEAIDDEITFAGVELDTLDSSADTAQQETVTTGIVACALALGADHTSKCHDEPSSRLFQTITPRADAGVVALCRKME